MAWAVGLGTDRGRSTGSLLDDKRPFTRLERHRLRISFAVTLHSHVATHKSRTIAAPTMLLRRDTCPRDQARSRLTVHWGVPIATILIQYCCRLSARHSGRYDEPTGLAPYRPRNLPCAEPPMLPPCRKRHPPPQLATATRGPCAAFLNSPVSAARRERVSCFSASARARRPSCRRKRRRLRHRSRTD